MFTGRLARGPTPPPHREGDAGGGTMMEEGNVSGVGVTVGSVRYDEDDKAAGAASVGRTPAVTPRRAQMDEVGDLELSSRRLIGTSINGSVCSSVRAEGSQFTDVDEISASPGTLMWRTRSMMRRKVNNLSRAELKEYSKDLSVDFNAVPDERDAPVTGSTVASVNLISTNTMDSMRTMDSSGEGEVQAQSIGSKILHLIRENKRVRTGLKREAFARLGEWVAWVRRLETHAAHSAEPLSKDEITHIREQLVIEMGFGPSLHLLKTFDARDTNRADMVLFAIQELLCSPVGADVGKDATHAYTRQLIRSANKDKCCGVDGVQTAREWFTSLRKQISPRFTSNVVKESTLILGQGPNGGYAGYVPRQFAGSYALKSATIMAGGSAMPVAPPVSDVSIKSDGSKGGVAEEAGRLSSLWRGRFRASKPLKEWLLHGDDINQRRDLRAARDSEIAGFFSECIDLRIGSIVANGFVVSCETRAIHAAAAARNGTNLRTPPLPFIPPFLYSFCLPPACPLQCVHPCDAVRLMTSTTWLPSPLIPSLPFTPLPGLILACVRFHQPENMRGGGGSIQPEPRGQPLRL